MSGSFLQSSEWESFQKSVGRKTWRVDDVLLIRHELPAGFSYLYNPRPKSVTSNWLRKAGSIGEKEKAVFLKIDPVGESRNSKFEILKSNNIQPRKTVVNDLRKSEEELLRAMHEKTRYNIRLAERRGVAVASTRDPTTTDALIWWSLLSTTARREGFRTHEKVYYEKLLRTKSENFSNELFLADCNMTALAGAIVNFYWPARTATYLHGASSREGKEVMAPALLHWRIMQEAKRRGFHHYDFWGIDEIRWPGLTRFKTGFGGKIFAYPESGEVVYRPFLYNLYKLAKYFRRAL